MKTAHITLKNGFQPYSEYRDSGIEWIGKIPKDWETLKVRHIFREVVDLSVNGSEELLSVSEYFGVKPRKEAIKAGGNLTNAESLEGYKRCSKGDLVMNIMLAWKTGLGVTEYEGIVSPAYSVFRLRTEEFEPKYLHYLLRTKLYTEVFRQYSTGVIDSRLRLYPDKFFNVPVIFPDHEKQQKIAAYLDEKTALIDRIIEDKQKLATLLRERRSAIINQAVTRGLDSNAELIDSGIEWIGKIPKEWGLKKLKHVARVEGGYAFSSGSYMNANASSALLIRITEVKDQIIEEGRRYVSNKFWDILTNFRVYKGDILITLTGYVGDTAVFPLEEKALLNQRVGKIRPSKSIHPMYLYYCTKPSAFKTFLSLRSKSSAQENVSNSDVGEFTLPFPSESEQQKIVEYLDDQCEGINHTYKLLEQSISLLHEFKSSLISNVVTGKVKV